MRGNKPRFRDGNIPEGYAGRPIRPDTDNRNGSKPANYRAVKERQADFPSVAEASIDGECFRCGTRLGAMERMIMADCDGTALQVCLNCVGKMLYGRIKGDI